MKYSLKKMKILNEKLFIQLKQNHVPCLSHRSRATFPMTLRTYVGP